MQGSLTIKPLELKLFYSPLALQVLSLCGYAVVAREVYHFERPHSVTALIILVALVFDTIIGVIKFKKLRFPFATITTGFACSLLLDSPYLWVYLFAAVIAVLSKAFILVENRHIFNPANFAVVVVLLLFPEFATGMPQLFASHYQASVAFFMVGLCVAVYAKVIDMTLVFIACFAFFAFLRADFDWYHGLTNLYLLLSPAMLLFMFQMITDPMTIPKSFKFRLIWAVSIATIDYIFRQAKIPYGNFYALFLITCLLPFVWQMEKKEKGI